MKNLKCAGLAFRLWTPESGNGYPFREPGLTNPHTGILLTGNTTTARAWMHFQTLSNEIQNPKILVCPADRSRITNAATDFLNGPNSLCAPSKRDHAVSYFVGLSADETMAQAILTGDRNLAPTNTLPAYSTIAQGGAVRVSITSQWSAHPSSKLHDGTGSIVMADGSAQVMNDSKVGDALEQAQHAYGTNANLFLFPQ